jgi:uncharacterized protein YjaZ
LIQWQWIYRDFVETIVQEGKRNWKLSFKEYLKSNEDILRDIHFLPKGFNTREDVIKRIDQLDSSNFINLLDEITANNEYENQIKNSANQILSRFDLKINKQEVYVIVGLDFTNIYSVSYQGNPITVICLESVGGNLQDLNLLLSHEIHHWIRQSIYDYDLFESTLGERVVTEGLAANYTEFLYSGYEISEYCFVPKDTVHWTITNFDRIENILLNNMQGQSYINCLFSRKPKDKIILGMPSRVGYVYGYLKVNNYLQNNECNAEKAANIPWQRILLNN